MRAATNTRRTSWLLVLGASTLLTGCLTERETTLMRSSRAREARAMQEERDRLVRDLGVLEQTRDDARLQIVKANTDSVNVSAELRAVRADLSYRLGELVHAEQDLKAAQQRAAEIEKELAPLRALESTLQQQAKLRADAQQHLAALQQEVAATEAQAQKEEAVLQPRLQEAKDKLAIVQKAGKSLATAEAALAEALATIAPPPPAPAPAQPKKE